MLFAGETNSSSRRESLQTRVRHYIDCWGLEFGEHCQEAVVREFEEELGVEFTDSIHVGTFEQMFPFDGETNHEIWRVSEERIVEDWPNEHETFTFTEPDLGTVHLSQWQHVEALRDDEITFYVPAVLAALET